MLQYRERFGDDFYSFWAGGVLYLSINSQYYRDTEAAAALGPLRDEQA